MKRRLANDISAMYKKKNAAQEPPTRTAAEEGDVNMADERPPSPPPPANQKHDSATTNNNDSYMYSDDEDEYSYTSSNENQDEDDEQENEITVAVSNDGYCFCSKAQVKQFMESSIQEVSDLLCLPPEAAVVLLRNYKWDGKKLTDDYFASSTQEEIQTKCGVFHRCSTTKDDSTSSSHKTMACCEICFDDELKPEDVFGMTCGHEFCKDCWSGYIAEALSRGPSCVFMQCPQPKCGEVVTDLEVAKLAPSLLSKFQDFQLRSYIESSHNMRYCPGKACECVAVGSSADGLVGEGSCRDCGTCFCLACGEMQHIPALCEMMVVWNAKCQDESETANWMLAKTKKCPKCDARINKNGGCNHMRCSQCNYHFCWLCMQDWKVHGYERSCNEFDLQSANSKDSTRANAEQELERYLFCFKRFQNHSQGQDFAQKELDKFSEKQEENEETDASFDWNALKDALRQLVECRRVLKYTYVVTYSLADKPLQRELFEDHQGLLERFTEMLSEISEKDYKQIDRTELVNLTRTVEKYTKGVMDCEIDNGEM